MSKSWYSQTTLASGLRVLVAPTDSPSVTVTFMARTGSKNEVPSQSGISHFLEHFVFKGTKKYPTSRDVMRAMDSIGASPNAATGKEATYYYAKASKAHLERAIEFIGEIIFRPQLPANLMDKEKGTILQEIAMYEDLPMQKIASRFEELYFGPSSPLGRAIIGTKNTVSSLTRGQLVKYRQKWYRPGTTVLAVAGGVQKSAVIKHAQKYLGKFDPDSSPGVGLDSPGVEPGGKSSRRLIDTKPTDQVHLSLGVRAFRRHDPRRYQLGVLSTILGGNASSQLFDLIREQRGLAYYVKTTVNRYQESGYLAVRAGVPPDKAAAVEKLIRDHLANFTFSAKDLTDAKEYLKGQLALSWEDSFHQASHLAEEALFEPHIRSLVDITRAIDQVSKHQVKSLADKLFADQDSIYIAAIGPVDNRLKLVNSKR